MSDHSAKVALERGIFERFAQAAGLAVVPGSIAQPDPPDITCEIRGFGLVNFELTAVDDVAALTRMALLARTDEFWSQSLDNLDAVTRERLRSTHDNVQVALAYAEPGDKRQRRDSMRAVLERLADKPSDFVGQLYNRYELIPAQDLPAADRAAREQFKALPPGSGRSRYSLIDPPPAGIRSAEVQRLQSVSGGPRVFGISTGGFQPIDLSRIAAKLAREDYRSDRRLELLAYVRWGDSASLEDRDFTGYLAERIAGTSFARIWIFETAMSQIVARYP